MEIFINSFIFLALQTSPVSSNPLAMLAKTCQNIGHMMEHGSMPPTTSSTATHSWLGVTSASAVNTTHNNAHEAATAARPSVPVSRPTRPPNPTLCSGSQFAPPKRSPVSRERRTMVPSKSMSYSPPVRTPPSISPSNVNNTNNYRPTVNGHHVATYTTSDGLKATSVSPPLSIQPTSNALAQLARLSSSLPLPDGTNSQDSGIGRKSAWNDHQLNRFQPPAAKRLRQQKPKSVMCTAAAATTTTTIKPGVHNGGQTSAEVLRRLARESAVPGQASNPTRSYPGEPFGPFTFSPAAAATMWTSFLHFIQQSMSPVETHKPQLNGDLLAYHLARSFMETFHSKQWNPPTQPEQPLPPPPAMFPPGPGPAERVHQANPGFDYLNPLSLQSPGHHSTPTPAGAPTQVNYCPFCRQQCSGQTDLCNHIYLHLISPDSLAASHASARRQDGVPAGTFPDPSPQAPNHGAGDLYTAFASFLHFMANQNQPDQTAAIPPNMLASLSDWFNHYKGSHLPSSAVDKPASLPQPSDKGAVSSSGDAWFRSILSAYCQSNASGARPSADTPSDNSANNSMWSQFFLNSYLTTAFPQV